MTESSAVDMDAILDEALDELDDEEDDDDDDDVNDDNCDVIHQDIPQQKKDNPASSDPSTRDTTAVTAISTENLSSSAASAPVNDIRRVSFGPARPPPPATTTTANNNSRSSKNKNTDRAKASSEEQILAESFQRMFQDLNLDDPNGNGNGSGDDTAEGLGNYLMKQMQSELQDAAANGGDGNGNGNGNGNGDNNMDFDDNQIQETMTAILGGMSMVDSNVDVVPEKNGTPSVTTNDTTTTTPSKTKTKSNNKNDNNTTKTKSKSKTSKTTSPSDEEKLLQGLFQGLMAATGGDGDDNDDPTGGLENDCIPNLDDLFAGMNGNGGVGGAEGKSNNNNDNDNDFNTDNFMDGMMEQLLSKELMYEPMKQVTEKFPSWLESNKNRLTPEEWDQRNRQYDCFQQLVKAYEEDEGGTNTNDNKQTGRLMELMQQVQEYGQPPPEIINEIAPGLELDEEGLPKMNLPGGMMPPFMGMGGNPGEEECSIM